jgi:hypothetical protein
MPDRWSWILITFVRYFPTCQAGNCDAVLYNELEWALQVISQLVCTTSAHFLQVFQTAAVLEVWYRIVVCMIWILVGFSCSDLDLFGSLSIL